MSQINIDIVEKETLSFSVYMPVSGGGTGEVISINGRKGNVVLSSSEFDHNQLTNYDANRHFLQEDISITKSQVSDFGTYENPLTFSDGLTRTVDDVTNTDKGSVAVESHEGAFVHGDIAHTNRSALDLVSGTNTGDQDLTAYEKSLGNPSADDMVLSSKTDGTRSWTAAGGGGLTHWTDENSTANSAVLEATSTQSVVECKIGGSKGATSKVIVGSLAGNNRGNLAVDIQPTNVAVTQVASGAETIAVGYRTTASGLRSISLGSSSTASGDRSVSIGYRSSAGSGNDSINIGGGSAEQLGAIQIGRLSSITWFSFTFGLVDPARKVTLNRSCTAVAPIRTLTSSTTNSQENASNIPPAPANHVVAFTGLVTATKKRSEDANVISKAWEVKGAIKRVGATAAGTILVGTPSITVLGADEGTDNWTVTIEANTSFGGLAVIGNSNGDLVRFSADINTIEQEYA